MKKTILIIEDNPDLSENTTDILELAGYKTLTASDGKTGLELARKQLPDLILCDIMMPGMDGYGVIKALENVPETTGIPFIFISAKANKEDLRMGMDLGADDYLTKPFNGDELLRVVSSRLKKNLLIKHSYDNTLEGLNKFIKSAKTEQGLHLLSDHRTEKNIKKKEMLYMEGDSPNFLHFLISGKLKAFKSNESGKEYIISIYKEGDFLGYTSLLEEAPYKESTIAIENSIVALIPKQDFFQLLYSNNEIALTFIRLISKNYSETEEKLLKLAYDSARKRVAEAIVFVYKKYTNDAAREGAFTLHRENISALSGISPESVSRNLTDFREEGLIETKNGRIKILDLNKLETIRN